MIYHIHQALLSNHICTIYFTKKTLLFENFTPHYGWALTIFSCCYFFLHHFVVCVVCFISVYFCQKWACIESSHSLYNRLAFMHAHTHCGGDQFSPIKRILKYFLLTDWCCYTFLFHLICLFFWFSHLY